MSISFYFENLPKMTLCYENTFKYTKYVAGNIIKYIYDFYNTTYTETKMRHVR